MNPQTTPVRFRYNGDECVALFNSKGVIISYCLNSLRHVTSSLYDSYIDIAYAHYRNQPVESEPVVPQAVTDDIKQRGI